MIYWKIPPQKEIMVKSDKMLIHLEEITLDVPKDILLKVGDRYIKAKQLTEVREVNE